MPAFFKYLRNGSDPDMAVDGSGTPVDYALENDSDQTIYVHRLIIYMEDGGPFSADNFAGLGGPLSNGVPVLVLNSSDVQVSDLTDGVPINRNSEWSALCYDVAYINFGSGNDALSVRWAFRNSGAPVALPVGHKLVMRIQDNLEDLAVMYAQAQGVAPGGF